jgi:hypothetical protein
MTIDQRDWPTFQHVSCPAADAATCEFHKICLAQSNHELTRMNTNLNLPESARCGDLVAVSRRNELPRTNESGRQELRGLKLWALSVAPIH